MAYCPPSIASATAALVVNEQLAVLRGATPTELFQILERYILNALYAHNEAMVGWHEPKEN